jgi:hypothetical protein
MDALVARIESPHHIAERHDFGIAPTRDLYGAWQVDPQPIVPLDEQIANASLSFETAHKNTWLHLAGMAA